MKKSLSTIASLILTVFFVCIMLFIMITGMNILDSNNGSITMFFTIIDCLILILLVGLGKPIFRFIGVVMYIPITVATVVYVIVAMSSTLLLFNCLTAFLFTAIKLVMLFVFLCVIIPLAVTGKNTNHNQDTRPEIKKHNID